MFKSFFFTVGKNNNDQLVNKLTEDMMIAYQYVINSTLRYILISFGSCFIFVIVLLVCAGKKKQTQ